MGSESEFVPLADLIAAEMKRLGLSESPKSVIAAPLALLRRAGWELDLDRGATVAVAAGAAMVLAVLERTLVVQDEGGGRHVIAVDEVRVPAGIGWRPTKRGVYHAGTWPITEQSRARGRAASALRETKAPATRTAAGA